VKRRGCGTISRHKSPGGEVVNQDNLVRLPDLHQHIAIQPQIQLSKFQGSKYLQIALLHSFFLKGELILTVCLPLIWKGLVKESKISKYGKVSHCDYFIENFYWAINVSVHTHKNRHEVFFMWNCVKLVVSLHLVWVWSSLHAFLGVVIWKPLIAYISFVIFRWVAACILLHIKGLYTFRLIILNFTNYRNILKS